MVKAEELLSVMRHDMHKIRIAGAPSHKDSIGDEVSREADGVAAFFSRNFLKEHFEDTPYRKSLVFQAQNLLNPRALVNQQRLEAASLFGEMDAVQLHSSILKSKLLNLFSEARDFPYTSLKYHILLTCALYYNFKSGFKLKDLYLTETSNLNSPFQIIYEDPARTWALLPQTGMAKVHRQFYTTWERRIRISFGGEHQILDELLTSIGSWTVALATIEDFFALLTA
jgi:hypothetical protein